MSDVGARRLNVGCGHDVRRGWVNLDVEALPGVDVVHDLSARPYPFGDAAFDEADCVHVLEHVDDLVATVRELHRILAPGGRMSVRSPHFTSHSTYIDPTHRRTFSVATFDFFVAGTMFQADRSYYADFAFSGYERRRLGFGRARSEPWNPALERLVNSSPARLDFYERTGASRLFPAQQIDLVLVK